MIIKPIHTVYFMIGRLRFKSVVHADTAEEASQAVRDAMVICAVMTQEQIDPQPVQDEECRSMIEPKPATF